MKWDEYNTPAPAGGSTTFPTPLSTPNANQMKRRKRKKATNGREHHQQGMNSYLSCWGMARDNILEEYSLLKTVSSYLYLNQILALSWSPTETHIKVHVFQWLQNSMGNNLLVANISIFNVHRDSSGHEAMVRWHLWLTHTTLSVLPAGRQGQCQQGHNMWRVHHIWHLLSQLCYCRTPLIL